MRFTIVYNSLLLHTLCTKICTTYTPPRCSNKNSPIFDKLQFKRKGSWILIRRTFPYLILLRFGTGHPAWHNISALNLVRFKKHLAYHGIAFILPPHTIPGLTSRLVSFKPLNCYTQRGLRAHRYCLLKRTGKESQYTQLKSKVF